MEVVGRERGGEGLFVVRVNGYRRELKCAKSQSGKENGPDNMSKLWKMSGEIRYRGLEESKVWCVEGG